jgi:hypothetical protein
MKSINVTFTDEELTELKETKGDRTWREAILDEFDVE